jgi:hypothetical protein
MIGAMMAVSSDCERVRPAGLAQPVNTVTSAAYAAAAVGVAAVARRSAGPLRSRLVAYAAALLGLGAGSVRYHANLPGAAHRLHDGALWSTLVLGSAVLVPTLPRREASRRGLALTTAAAVAAYLLGRSSSPLCRPDAPWQLHGLWHVLSARTAYLVAVAARDVTARTTDPGEVSAGKDQP